MCSWPCLLQVKKRKKTNKVKQALRKKIPIVDEDFLKACQREHR